MESPSVPFMLKFFFYTTTNILLVVEFENILQKMYPLDFKWKKIHQLLKYAFRSVYQNFGLKFLLIFYDNWRSFPFFIV